jgi:hypothetical protein
MLKAYKIEPIDYKPIAFDFDESKQNEMMNHLINEFRKMEEDLLKKVVFQITKKEATVEDAKRLTKFYYEGEPLNYDLAWDGVKIGCVVFGNEQFKWSVTFHPCP